MRSSVAAAILTPRDVVAPLFRHRKVVLWTSGIVFALCLLVAWGWAARYYRAGMQVLATAGRMDPAMTSAQSAAITSRTVTTDQINSEVALLQGRDLLQAVAAACGLDRKWHISDLIPSSDSPQVRGQKKLEGAARGLAKHIKVEVDKQSDVIDVAYGTTDGPEAAACVLQNLGDRYLAKHMMMRRQAGSSEFFAHETDEAARGLSRAEARLADFSRSEGGAAPDLMRNDMAQQLAAAEGALDRSRETIASDEERIRSLARQLHTLPARSETQEVQNSASSLLQQLESSLLAAQVRRLQLLMKFDPSYPLVVQADQEIADTREAIERAHAVKYINRTTDRDPTYELLKQDLARTEVDLASQRAAAAALESSKQSLRQQLGELDRRSVERSGLERDVKAAESSYLLYLAKRDQERTSDAMDQDRMADVKIAVAAAAPALPAYSPMLVMLLGFIGAASLGMAAGFAAQYMDPFLRTPEDVATALNVRVLAAVPRHAA
jgi:uncharacterized protein involved in exopolysaccharide biosynthesis